LLSRNGRIWTDLSRAECPSVRHEQHETQFTLSGGIGQPITGSNSDAIRLYERRGFRPTWMYLSRFSGRPA